MILAVSPLSAQWSLHSLESCPGGLDGIPRPDVCSCMDTTRATLPSNRSPATSFATSFKDMDLVCANSFGGKKTFSAQGARGLQHCCDKVLHGFSSFASSVAPPFFFSCSRNLSLLDHLSNWVVLATLQHIYGSALSSPGGVNVECRACQFFLFWLTLIGYVALKKSVLCWNKQILVPAAETLSVPPSSNRRKCDSSQAICNC